MTLAPGTRLGPYEILSSIGAGGMGEVYRARDTKLDRDVAIKIMPPAFARDADRLARFEREAKLLASLSHPNIAPIYGFQEDGDTRALVMELIEGHTLHAPLPLPTALNYARQIAEAVEAAHEKGITHRDLKPRNIMVTPEGVVKVLDFGLASSSAAETGSDPANSPTITMAAATQAGVILGTAAYMSPEQAAGKPVDKRSDIWSFGVVLYEMLTGARLFEGETLSHTLAHVLTRPIDLDRLPKDTPPPIVALLRRCLDRDPKTRLRDIGEARIAIDRYLAQPASESAAPPVSAPRVRSVALWLAAGVVIALAAVFGWRLLQPKPPAPPGVRFTVSMPPKAVVIPYDSMALSPDQRYLAFTLNFRVDVTSRELWLRPLDSIESHVLPGTKGASFPFWSADSRYIAFSTIEGLKKVPVEGGPPVRLTSGRSLGGTWNRQGVILTGSMAGPIRQVHEGGGEAGPVLALDKSRNESGQGWPQFLPDGRHFLYLSRFPGGTAVYRAELGSSRTQKVADADGQAVYAHGYLFFPRTQTLMAQPFDASSGKFTGPSFIAVEKIGVAPELMGSLFSASESGALAFRQGSDAALEIAVLNRNGQKIGTAGPPGDYAQITLSPDEKRLAIDRRQNGNYDIWMLELSTGVFSRVTSDPGNDRDPVFSADGRQIVFTSDRLGMPHIYRKTIGGGPEELTYRGPDREATEAWLKDGSVLFGNLRGRKYFLLRPGETGEPKLIYQSESTVDEPAISPDGKWIAYGSDESGQWEAYVARFPEWDQRKQISTDGGMQPHWRVDGREIVYCNADGRLMSVNVTAGAGLETSSPALLFATGLRGNGSVEQWTMSHNASKFYVLTSLPEGDKPITVMLNWRK